MSILKNKKHKHVTEAKKERPVAEPKFLTYILSKRIQSALFVEININFLGSCHVASKHSGAGERYGKYNHIYYNYSSRDNANTFILNFTFSGPTKLDVLKPNIKSITKEAQDVLTDLITNISLLKKNIIINIEGHSRGGIVANNIYKWLLLIPLENSIRIGKFSIADPYAGPVNRRVYEETNDFDRSLIPVHMSIPANKVVVYSVNERRFRTPAKSLESDIVVFTDVSHDKTKYIAEYIFKNIHDYERAVYIYPDPNNEIKMIMDIIVKKNPTPKEQVVIDEWIRKRLEKVCFKNMKDILEGKGKYKNFAYNRISTDGRRAMLYKSFAGVDEAQVKNFLNNNKHNGMYKKIQKM